MGLPGHWNPHGYLRKPLKTPPTKKVCVVTQSITSNTLPDQASNVDSVSVESAFTDTDLVTLQSLDPAINKMVLFLSNDSDNPSESDFQSIPNLKRLFATRSALRLVIGVLVHVSDALSSPAFVVPRNLGTKGG